MTDQYSVSSSVFQVETQSPRHGGESVAEVLRAHGVKFVFTLVGGHISPILVACEKVGIRIVDTRHEATAVFAADAVARLSGTVLSVTPVNMAVTESEDNSRQIELFCWTVPGLNHSDRSDLPFVFNHMAILTDNMFLGLKPGLPK